MVPRAFPEIGLWFGRMKISRKAMGRQEAVFVVETVLCFS